MPAQTHAAVINGIDVEALLGAIAAIEANPAEGATTWKVTSRWNGGTRTDHFVDGFTMGGNKVDRHFQIQIDEPKELCGTDQFANPQEYLLAATNACMMVGYSAVAALMGIELSKLEIEISGDIDLQGFLNINQAVAPGYERLHYVVHLAGNATAEQLEQLHATVQRTSPNYYNISNPIELTCDLIVE
ncbi:MAG: OsmC family protein [Lacipirellulaceae bacterium]